MDVPDSDQKNLLTFKISTKTYYDVLDFQLKKYLAVRFLVREFGNPSNIDFIFLEQVRLRETNVFS